MNDPLERVLREAQGWQPPPGHVEAVRKRGRNVKRVRLVGFAAMAILVLAAGSFSTYYITAAPRQQVLQTTVPPDERPDDMIPKVARFAFRALLQTGSYEVDYKGTEKHHDGWMASFVSGPTVQELRRSLRIAQETVEEFRASVQRLRNQITGNQRLATVGSARKEAKRELRQLQDQLRMTLRFSLPAAVKDVRTFRALLEETVTAGGPRYTTIEIIEDDGLFGVLRLTGPPHDPTQRLAVESFTEPVPERLVGWEFFDVKITGEEGNRSWSGRGFYVGDVPSPERVRCGVRLWDAENRLVARTPTDKYVELDAARSEDDRDGLGIGAEIELLVEDPPPASSLSVGTDCRLISGNWEVVGEVTFRPVAQGDRQSHSDYQLDPERHVMVETELEYRGDPTGGQHICIAKVFDEGGDPIDSHGLTLYPSEIDRSDTNHVAIAVDVGDPSLAASATIECQPVIPGVPLGPDQD